MYVLVTEFGSRCNNVIYIFIKARVMEKGKFFCYCGEITYCFRTKSGEGT